MSVSRCAHCDAASTPLTCKGCHVTRYCSGKCASVHWDTSHHVQCVYVGLENRAPFEEKMRTPTRGKAPVIEDLFTRLQQPIPVPTPQDLQNMTDEARRVGAGNPVDTALAFKQIEEQRQELYKNVLMHEFLHDYLRHRDVREDVIERVSAELHAAEAAIANAALDILNGENEATFDANRSQVHSDKAMNIVLLATRQDPTVFMDMNESDGKRDDFKMACATAFEIAMTMNQTIAASRMTKDDSLTRRFHFEPDARWEGTDEDIDQRIAEGILSDDIEWWANRFDYFTETPVDNVNAFIGAPTRKNRSKSPRRRQAYVPNSNNDPPADARARQQVARNAWDWLRDAVRVTGNSFSVVQDRLEQILQSRFIRRNLPYIQIVTDFSLAVLILIGASEMMHNMMLRDVKSVEQFQRQLGILGEKMDKVTMSTKSVRKLMDLRKPMFKKLNSFFEQEGKKLNMTSFNFYHGYYHMSSVAGPVVPYCGLPDDAAYSAFVEGRTMVEYWFQVQLYENRVSVDPLNIIDTKHLKGYYEIISNPDTSNQDVMLAIEKYASYIQKPWSKVDLTTFTSEKQGLDVAQHVLNFLRDHEEIEDQTMRLMRQIQDLKQNVDVTVDTAERVVRIAEHAARTTPLHERVVRDTVTDPAHRIYLTFLLRTIMYSNQYMVNTTIMKTKAVNLMEKINMESSVYSFALNSPDIMTRTGMFLLCNNWTLGWLIHVVNQIEHFSEERLNATLARYDEVIALSPIAKARNEAIVNAEIYSLSNILKRLLRFTVPGTMRMTRRGILYGQYIGIALVLASASQSVTQFNFTELSDMSLFSVGPSPSQGYDLLRWANNSTITFHGFISVFYFFENLGYSWKMIRQAPLIRCCCGMRDVEESAEERRLHAAKTDQQLSKAMSRANGYWTWFLLFMFIINGLWWMKTQTLGSNIEYTRTRRRKN